MKKIVITVMGLLLLMISVTPTIALEETKSLRMLVVEIRENKIENQKIINELKLIRLNIRANIKQVKEDDITLNQDTLDIIRTLVNDIKEIRSSILATKGDIMDLQDETKSLIKERQWNDVSEIYEQIIDIQEIRYDDLVRLLDKMSQLNRLFEEI